MLDLIHHMDVVDQLIAAGTSSAGEWQWRKQLRFGAGADGKVTIHMVSASFDYTYEYQGNAPKLVHTPLTDKCYLTLTQAMFMGYGGNPYGPAGTGKTESVKALGGAFGRQVLVFNCDEGIDSKSMGRIFMGLVKCGAWGCFDEFNRLLPDQLSEISQQIQVIQAAIKARQPRMELEGTTTEVDANAGIFVTMNPAGKGYGGRSKLPDNLKALFRAVAMSAPNNEMIAEVMLYSEGFAHAKALAVKLVAIFSLSKQLLSPQQHYDWGLRALKTVLRVGGQLVAAEKKTRGGAALDEAEEAMLVIKALRVNTLSKLTHGDTAAFNALVGDVFPDAVPQDVAYDELEAALKEVIWPRSSRHATPHLTPHIPILHPQVMAAEKLEVLPLQVKKILQFYEATQQRMGVVIVGPSGCGKSTIWQMLKAALLKLGQKIPTYVMNPKSMPREQARDPAQLGPAALPTPHTPHPASLTRTRTPREQLLGHMDMDTREWFDGVLTASARKVVREPPEVRSWVICDGDIDPEWVESLNSVLDDNRLLTMPSGERIQFGPNVNFIFETHDLKFASPATVSRMGMIYLDQDASDVKCIVSCWVRRHDARSGRHSSGPTSHAPHSPHSHIDRCAARKRSYSSTCSRGSTTSSGAPSSGCSRMRRAGSSTPRRPASSTTHCPTWWVRSRRASLSVAPSVALARTSSSRSAPSSPSRSTRGATRRPPTTGGRSTGSTTRPRASTCSTRSTTRRRSGMKS